MLINVTVKGYAANNDIPMPGGDNSPTRVSVALIGDRALPANVTVRGIYVVAGGQVYRVNVTDRHAQGDNPVRHEGRISPKIDSNVTLNMAALISDGTTAVLVRDPENVPIFSAQ